MVANRAVELEDSKRDSAAGEEAAGQSGQASLEKVVVQSRGER